VLPNYNYRAAALKFVLLGSKPVSQAVVEVVAQFDELKAAGALKTGPVAQQYEAFKEEQRRRASMQAQGNKRRSSIITPHRASVIAAKRATVLAAGVVPADDGSTTTESSRSR
jgi:hypothetical protein